MTIFLSGDVMTGRGIDQIMAHRCNPVIHEGYMESALGYVDLAEQQNGLIPSPVSPRYIWGDALIELERMAPGFKLINLETAVTTSEQWVAKGINYRMHPKNVACLAAAGIHCCSLANNHALDWGISGLIETLETLKSAGIQAAGAGHDREEAEAAVVFDRRFMGRVLVVAFGMPSSGVPREWAASEYTPGLNLVEDLSIQNVARVAAQVRKSKRMGDIAIASVHWGGNWGYEISQREIRFAHALIDEAGIDILHGHSSHHPKAIEVYRGKPIFYGCGDLIDDYEGIGGYEEFRNDLGLMYFVAMNPMTGELEEVVMSPMQKRRLSLHAALPADARWLETMLSREGKRFGTSVTYRDDGRLHLRWNQAER